MPSTTRNWRRIFRWLAICCFAFLSLLFTIAWFVGGALVAADNHPVSAPPTDLHVAATTLNSDSGSQIATWYIPSENAHATIVLLHPIHTARGAMLGRARLFHDAG